MKPLAKSSIQWRAGWLTPALMLLGLIAVACQGNPPPAATVTVPPTEQGTGYAQPDLLADTIWLEKNLGHDDLLILDVRSSASYIQGHIPGAVHLPRGQLELRADSVFPDPTVRILAYCEFGKISTIAAATLRTMGFSGAVALDGGMRGWVNAGCPVEKVRGSDSG